MNSVKKKELLEILLELLRQPSPTFSEKQIFDYLRKILRDFRDFRIHNENSSGMIFSFFVDDSGQNSPQNTPQHLAFFAHVDVVPEFFEPYRKAGKVYGAGASDMKAGLAAFVYLMLHYFDKKKKISLQQHAKNANANKKYQQISFIFYAAEETQHLKDNGLFTLLQQKKSFFQSIDFAVVGEPTDRSLQLGAVGSAHVKVVFKGQSCHSARPWQGENALYKAQKFIQNISKIKPKKQKVGNLDFFDTLNITESHSEKGRTTIPGWWEANINFRYAPIYTEAQAKKKLIQQLVAAGAEKKNIDIYAMVYAGVVTSNAFSQKMLKKLQNLRKNLKIEPKQAWTDVAQLGKLKIPCCNYGPGLTAQCHKPQEYTLLKDLVDYTQHLQDWLESI